MSKDRFLERKVNRLPTDLSSLRGSFEVFKHTPQSMNETVNNDGNLSQIGNKHHYL
jgi:hypothetical protein